MAAIKCGQHFSKSLTEVMLVYRAHIQQTSHTWQWLLSDLRVEGSLEPMLPPWITSMLGHLLVLGGVRRIQAPAGRRRSGSGRDHARRRATGARVRQELGAVRGCSTHLGGEEKHNSRDIKKPRQCRGYRVVGRVLTATAGSRLAVN